MVKQRWKKENNSYSANGNNCSLSLVFFSFVSRRTSNRTLCYYRADFLAWHGCVRAVFDDDDDDVVVIVRVLVMAKTTTMMMVAVVSLSVRLHTLSLKARFHFPSANITVEISWNRTARNLHHRISFVRRAFFVCQDEIAFRKTSWRILRRKDTEKYVNELSTDREKTTTQSVFTPSVVQHCDEHWTSRESRFKSTRFDQFFFLFTW